MKIIGIGMIVFLFVGLFVLMAIEDIGGTFFAFGFTGFILLWISVARWLMGG